MTTQEVANRLVELCRMGQFEQAQKELYAADAISLEAEPSPMPRVEGLEAIIQKGQVFQSMVEAFHGITVSDPIIAGNIFSVTMAMDAQMKGKDRGMMHEVAVYKVKDGKITMEQFIF